MRVEHLQGFNVRGDHSDDRALFLAFKLCRAQTAECAEDLVTKHRKELECDIVIGILLKVTEQTAQNATTDGESDDQSVRERHALSKSLGNTERTEHGNAHCRHKAE